MRNRDRLGCTSGIGRLLGLVFIVVVFGPVLVGLGGVAIQCRIFGDPPAPDTPTAALPANVQEINAGMSDYARLEDQSYLTLPEWYIVYSADEYAAHIADNPPSSFPYFGAIRQFWGTYYDVCGVTRERYTFNTGYNVTLAVIGSSFTIENVLRGIYENTVGRVTEAISGGGQTEEDAYARAVATEYGTFLHTIPWYEFPYGEKLEGLWKTTGLWGPNVVRKWERKFALSIEYGAKAGYAWVIKLGTKSAFSPQDLQIRAWVGGMTEQIAQDEPDVEIVQQVDAEHTLVSIVRYDAFSQVVPRLVEQGVAFQEIAGNDEILVTILASRDWTYDLEDGDVLFEMPILTEAQQKRVAVNVPVTGLQRVIQGLGAEDVRLEHIYDY